MSKTNAKKTGVAFSGGGVRSAALCSGVLRRLLQKGVSIDHLSTVSGGGYTGASYLYWKYHNGKMDDPVWHKQYFEHLHKNINPICDCYNPFRGFVDGVLTIVLAIFLSIGISFLRSFAFVVPTAYIVDYLLGSILREQFTCHAANANRTVEGITPSKLKQLCLPKFGPTMEELIQAYLPLFAVFVVSYYLNTLGFRRTITYLLSFISGVSGYCFAMIFLPWFLEVYTTFTPRWANYFILVLVFVIWLFFPDLREKASFFLLILVCLFCKVASLQNAVVWSKIHSKSFLDTALGLWNASVDSSLSRNVTAARGPSFYRVSRRL